MIALGAVVTAAPVPGDLLPGSARAILALLVLVAAGLGAGRSSRPAGLAVWLAAVHVGFALLGLSMGCEIGTGPAIVTLGAMLIAVAGIALSPRRGGVLEGVFLLTLAGVPPTAGFAARFMVLDALVSGGFPVLALLAAVLSLPPLAAVVRMLVRTGDDPAAGEHGPPGITATVVAGVLAVVLVASGVFWPLP